MNSETNAGLRIGIETGPAVVVTVTDSTRYGVVGEVAATLCSWEGQPEQPRGDI
ncbi:MAG TPA: hypothetical protein VMF65_09615 [Acidimicrobiales bacterium]|nr:hypothetical protein [Acidimicrobiales bacterium]